jgi:hypothetical protein
LSVTAISALWIALASLVGIAVYCQVRSHKKLRQSLRQVAASYDRLFERLDQVIRELEDVVSEENASEPPELIYKPIQMDAAGASAALLQAVPEIGTPQEALQDKDMNRTLLTKVRQKDGTIREAEVHLVPDLRALLESEGWPTTPAEDKFKLLLNTFKDRIIYEPSAGNVTMIFANTVLSIIGESGRLNEAQKRMVKDLCVAINHRPLPTMLWADFVRARLDQPAIISRILWSCRQNKAKQARRLQRVIESHFGNFNLKGDRPIFVFGYSVTITVALKALSQKVPSGLRILVPEQLLPEREIPDGLQLERDIKKEQLRATVEVVDNEVALERIRRDKPGLFLMGCKVIGLRKTGELEIVNSRNASDFMEAASKSQIPVGVVAGAYKLWPTETYEKYRPIIKVEESHEIMPGNDVEWVMTEDGLFPREQFIKGYNDFFRADGIPLGAIRECLRKRDESPEDLASRDYIPNISSKANEIAKELEIEERPLENLPTHFLEAQKYYQEQLIDEEWLKKYLGKHVAIIGNNVVDSDKEFHKLSLRVRENYGYGPIYMPEVVLKPRKVYIGPRIEG